MEIISAEHAHTATLMEEAKHNNRLKKIEEARVRQFHKRVDSFIKTEIPNTIKNGIKGRKYSAKIYFPTYNSHDEEYFLNKVKPVLDSKGYKDIKWDGNHLCFSW